MAKRKVIQIGEASEDPHARCVAYVRDLLRRVEAKEIVIFAVTTVATDGETYATGGFKGHHDPRGPTMGEVQMLFAESSVLVHSLIAELSSIGDAYILGDD